MILIILILIYIILIIKKNNLIQKLLKKIKNILYWIYSSYNKIKFILIYII